MTLFIFHFPASLAPEAGVMWVLGKKAGQEQFLSGAAFNEMGSAGQVYGTITNPGNKDLTRNNIV